MSVVKEKEMKSGKRSPPVEERQGWKWKMTEQIEQVAGSLLSINPRKDHGQCVRERVSLHIKL